MAPQEEEKLPGWVKAGFALGDHTVNIQLATVSLFFLFFLTEIAGLPPSWAGLVLLFGRAVDAVTDPLVGSISDNWHSKWGRRHPFMYTSALPMAACFFSASFSVRARARSKTVEVGCAACRSEMGSTPWRSMSLASRA